MSGESRGIAGELKPKIGFGDIIHEGPIILPILKHTGEKGRRLNTFVLVLFSPNLLRETASAVLLWPIKDAAMIGHHFRKSISRHWGEGHPKSVNLTSTAL